MQAEVEDLGLDRAPDGSRIDLLAAAPGDHVPGGHGRSYRSMRGSSGRFNNAGRQRRRATGAPAHSVTAMEDGLRRIDSRELLRMVL